MFALVCIIGMFLSIKRRDDSIRVNYWIFAWFLVFIHFGAELLGEDYSGTFSKIIQSVSVSALELSAVTFLMSLSMTFKARRLNHLLLCLIAVPAMVYVNCLTWGVTAHWIYLLCIILASLGSLTVISYFLSKIGFFIVYLAIVCSVSLVWMVQNVLKDDPEFGLYYSLTVLFALSGLVYWRKYRRFSAGVIVSSFGFLAWASVFPTANWLSNSHPDVILNKEIWNIPKFFVAAGMLLTLMEEQAIDVRKAALKYQSLFELNIAAVYRSTMEGRLLECNPAFLKMFGFTSKDQALSANIPDLFTVREDRPKFIQDLYKTGTLYNYEIAQQRADGGRFWALDSAKLVNEHEQETILGTLIDITPQKKAETELRLSEERFSTVFRKSPIMCSIIKVEDATFLDVNETFLTVMLRSKDEIIGKTAMELGLWKDIERRNDFDQELRRRGSVQNMHMPYFDGLGNRKEGLYSAELTYVNGMECIIGMMVDLTEQKSLEQKAQQVQKLEAVGLLAGGIAHDFNNILGIISGYVELLSNQARDSQKATVYSSVLLDAVNRGADLTKQLLNFSKSQPFQSEVIELDPLLNQMAGRLQSMLGENIKLIMVSECGEKICMDPVQFEHVLLNLTMNAKDAMPNGGRLTISSSFGPMNFEKNAPNWIKLVFSDTGHGMDTSTKHRVFEPFFSTKEFSAGSGLGLATVYGIVQQAGWKIDVESEVGIGSRFTLFMPAVSTRSEKITKH